MVEGNSSFSPVVSPKNILQVSVTQEHVCGQWANKQQHLKRQVILFPRHRNFLDESIRCCAWYVRTAVVVMHTGIYVAR